MESKILSTLKEQVAEDKTKIVLENKYLVKISDNVKAALEEFDGCKSLSISACRLSSLNNLPDFPLLENLQLCDNNLKNEDLDVIQRFKNLKYLFLSGNKITDLQSLSKLKNCENLKILDVFGCPFTENEKYVDSVFEMLPSLKYVDCQDRNKKEVDYEFSDDTDEDEEEQDDSDDFLIDDNTPEADKDKILKKRDPNNDDNDELDNRPTTRIRQI